MKNTVRPRRRDKVLAEFLPDRTGILYDPRDESAYPLTATAAVVWQRCDGARTKSDMAAQLAEIFEAPSDRIEQDVQDLLRRLSEIGLLEASGGLTE